MGDRMCRWPGQLLSAAILCLALIGCGEPLPSAVTGGVAAPVATGGGPPGVSPAPTDPAEALIHRVEQAALTYARDVLLAQSPQVTALSKGSFAPGDPHGTVWIVQLMGDTFHLNPCPASATPTIYSHTCGAGTTARLGLRMSDLRVVDVVLYDIPATPTARLNITLPHDAVLQTREDAINAALKGEADTNGQRPHVVSVDLILAGQVEDLNNLMPDDPIWRVVLDHGQFGFSCPPDVATRVPCVSSSVTRYFDAITGDLRAEMYGQP